VLQRTCPNIYSSVTHADHRVIMNFHTATQTVSRVWKGSERISHITFHLQRETTAKLARNRQLESASFTCTIPSKERAE